MHNLPKGHFFGSSRKEIYLNGLTVVESAYYGITDCPWHYHENAYFAFTTSGNLIEKYKQKELILSTGSLMYHHSQEPHCNSRYAPYVSALHIDIDPKWFEQYDVKAPRPNGFVELRSPDLKVLFTRLLIDSRLSGSEQKLSIETALVQAFNAMLRLKEYTTETQPAWQQKIKELLYAKWNEPVSLLSLAAQVQLHPVYLCQQFPKVFHCTIGEYIRQIKIEKATEWLMQHSTVSLTSLAYDCGFADQSHFIRIFKKQMGYTPLHFRKLVHPLLSQP
jgi:AraC family transcriptional regulator